MSGKSDDAEEVTSSGAMDLASWNLELGAGAAPQTVGLRFQGVAIPQGSTILGAYVEFTALKAGSPPAEAVDAAVRSMVQLNARASEAALGAGASAATEVTGFGLLGHLHAMLRASVCAAELSSGAVPLLPEARALALIDFVGGSLGAQASEDFTTASAHTLKKDIDLGFTLFADILQRPAFPKHEFERVRSQILG